MMINKIALSSVLIASMAVGANAKMYTQEDMDKVLERLDRLERALELQQKETKVKLQATEQKIEEIQATNEQEIEALHERADENEFQATMNRIKWGGELEVTDNFIEGKTGSMPEYGVAGTEYDSNNKWTTKLRLSMEAQVNDKTKFSGRLSMYKNWSDSTTDGLVDAAEGRKPDGGSGLFVERAYVDYSPTENFTVTLGRQPSSDGPGMTLIQNTQRKATYPSLLFDGAADGLVLSSKLAPASTMNPTVRAAYGKGFQNQANYSPYTASDVEIDDLNVYGAFYEMSLPFKSMGDNLLVLSYVMGKDFIGHPQNSSAPNNSNLGDMNLAGIYFENNKAFGTNLSYFASAGWNMPDDNGKTVNFGAMTNNQDVTLIKENGHAYHLGMRYDFDMGLKLGYEFNYGSKYWFSFTNGSSDLLNKLATRGSVNDIYGIYQIDINQFIRFGYTHIDYDYTGSGWHIGTPVKTDDYIKRAYGLYNLRF
jgi:hypothetical protein